MMATHISLPPPIDGFDPNTAGAKSIKEQFLKQPEYKSCASCHNKIDPIGFLFETLDPPGEERTAYATSSKRKKKGLSRFQGQAIDTSSLNFKGYEFKKSTTSKNILETPPQRPLSKAICILLEKRRTSPINTEFTSL